MIIPLNEKGKGTGTLVVGAHTDTLGGGQGIIDNWSGCVMLAALYAELKATPLRHRILFAAFDGEELGAVGSKAFLDKLSRRERRQIRAMINLECLGVGELRTWCNGGSDALEDLLQATAAHVRTPVHAESLFNYHADSFSFVRFGIPAVTIHSLDPTKLWIINSKADTGEHINRDRLKQSLHLLKRFLLRLDKTSGEISVRDRDSKAQAAFSGLARAELKVEEGGVRVVRLRRDCPEARGGIQAGDSLLEAGGISVKRPEAVRGVLRSIRRGTAMEWTVRSEEKGEGNGVRKVLIQY
jgi:hypothetical protein